MQETKGISIDFSVIIPAKLWKLWISVIFGAISKDYSFLMKNSLQNTSNNIINYFKLQFNINNIEINEIIDDKIGNKLFLFMLLATNNSTNGLFTIILKTFFSNVKSKLEGINCLYTFINCLVKNNDWLRWKDIVFIPLLFIDKILFPLNNNNNNNKTGNNQSIKQTINQSMKQQNQTRIFKSRTARQNSYFYFEASKCRYKPFGPSLSKQNNLLI